MVSTLAVWVIFSLFLLPRVSTSSNYLIYPGSTSPLNLTCDPSTPPASIEGSPCLVTADTNTLLSISITAGEVTNGSSEIFRAHPLLVTCLQRFYSKLSSVLHILQFYLRAEEGLSVDTPDPAVNSELLALHRAGLAVSFGFSGASFHTLLQTAVSRCLDIFAAGEFSMGVVQLNDSIDLQLRPDRLHFYPTSINATFFELLDQSLSLRTLPNCPAAPFPANSSYPLNGSTAAQVVGQVYQPLSRSSPEFPELLQYPGTNISFHGCASTVTGYSAEARCATRVMSSRMFRLFRVLAGLLKDTSSELSVVQSWSPSPFNITDPQCYSSPLNTSLFSEGRAMVLGALGSLSLSVLAHLCRCSGFDYVYNGCGYVLVAVRHQRSTPPLTVVFPTSLLLPVAPYGAIASLYFIPPSISSLSPLFDSDGIRGQMLSLRYSVGQFAGPDRFFRLQPALVGCLELVAEKLSVYSPAYSLRVLQAYSRDNSSLQEDFTTGLAVRINTQPQDYPLLNLTLMVIRSCASYVSQQHTTLRKLHLGIYSDSLYLAIATNFSAWNQTYIPGLSDSFYSWARSRYMAGLSGTLVNPSSPDAACLNTILSSPPTPSYSSPYSLPRVVSYLASVQPNNCVSETNTEFCKESKPFRDKAISELLVIMKRKHWSVPSEALTSALTSCFSLCATCTEGDVWRDKLASCDNLVHWAPFSFISEPDNMHFYVMENITMNEYACSGSRSCLAKSPIFAVLAPTVEFIFRPNPNKAQELPLYSMADNPIPVYKLLDTVFALSGAGNITVWVSNENDLLVLKPVLRVLMLYNHKVTSVDVRLFQSSRLSAAQRQMDGNIHDWTSNGCPAYSRDVVAPYRISIVDTSTRARRDLHQIVEENNFGDYLAMRWKFADRRWIEKQMY